MKSLDDKQQQESREKIITIKSVALKLLYGMLILYLAVWAFSPIIARTVLKDWLKEHYQLEISESSSIRYNPFTSHLSVHKLSLQKAGEIVLHVNQVDIELRLHRLLMKQIFISEFEIEGLILTINKNQHVFEVAGISILKEPSSEIQIDQQKNQPSSYEVYAKLFKFKNNRATVKLNNVEHVFLLEKLLLSDVNLSSKEQQFSTLLLATINKAPVEFNADLQLSNSIGNINTHIKIQDFELSSVSEEISNSNENIAGQLNFESTVEFRFLKEGLSIASATTVINLKNLYLIKAEQIITQTLLSTTIDNLLFKLNNKGNKHLTIESFETVGEKLLMKQDDLLLNNSSHEISFQSLIATLTGDEQVNTSIEQTKISVGNIEGGNNNLEFDSSGSSFELKQLSFNSNLQLNINEIIIDGLNGNFLVKIPKTEMQTSTSGIEPEKPMQIFEENSSQSIITKIDRIAFVNSTPLVFIDEASSPSFTKQLHIEELLFSNIDGNEPEQESPFRFKGFIDEYSKFQFSGFIKPFTKKLNLKLSGQMTETPLPPLNNYIQHLLGFQFGSGELDVDINIEIKKSEIEGNAIVKIRGLGLASSKNYNQNVLQQQTALPLNMALGTLTDSHGNLELDIPMLGNVENPSFGISSFVALVTKKAIQSAAKKYLIATFVPYAELISMTISASDFVMRTRFEDLPYDNKQTKISEQQKIYVEQFIHLMNNKPKTQVKVCALATISELSSDELTTLDKPQKIAALMALSKLRMDNFKKHAVEQAIASSRILLCSPKIDLSEGSKPKIFMTI